ncbi:MAG TPA: hypothetical protein VFA41_13080 [Ktedonobacteraceae bacterium]|jgi:hypothetical protein|nr:hypothetical protein [Ktedonobacteraceae bacterium]
MKRKQFLSVFFTSAVFYGVSFGIALFLIRRPPIDLLLFQTIFYGVGLGLFYAWCSIRGILNLPVEDTKEFFATLIVALARLGYDLVEQKQTGRTRQGQPIITLTFAGRSPAQKGRIIAQLNGDIAIIAGPKKILQQIEQFCSHKKGFCVLV